MKILSIFFKKKKERIIPDELEKAREFGFITEEEMLRLKSERADEKLKNFLNEKKKK